MTLADCKTCGQLFTPRIGRKYCPRPECRQRRFPAVYRFVSPDGRSYVGAISDYPKRGDIRRSNPRLLVAFELHSPETWVFEVLERLPPGCSLKALREAEQHHIDRLHSWSPEFGFNMTPAAWTTDGPSQRAGRQRIAGALAAARQKRKLWLRELEAVKCDAKAGEALKCTGIEARRCC